MAEDMTFLPRKALLSLEELERVCSVFIALGVQKLRITGGEPLVRRGIMSFFRGLGGHLASGNLSELTLTTNGALLNKYAQDLIEAGVKRINVSLDTLDQNKFAELTRIGKYHEVIAGIEAAASVGLKVKINTVALKGINDDEFNQLLAWCGEREFDISFIESMPMGEIGEMRADTFMSLDSVKLKLSDKWTLQPSSHSTAGPATYMDVLETAQRVGFITPFSHNFCESCNRVRLTCTGMLYLCLGQEDAVDLRQPLRDGATDAELKQVILEAIQQKPQGHDFDEQRLQDGAQVVRFMNTTGG